jgi:Pyruvate/2-oxoacid:ferredoxin oxidoreductase delta subunit
MPRSLLDLYGEKSKKDDNRTKNGPKWAQNRPKTDQNLIENGSRCWTIVALSCGTLQEKQEIKSVVTSNHFKGCKIQGELGKRKSLCAESPPKFQRKNNKRIRNRKVLQII